MVLLALGIVSQLGAGLASAALSPDRQLSLGSGISTPVEAADVAPRPPAAMPVLLEIPDAGVAAQVGPVGLQEDRTMEVPADTTRVGWYEGLEAPGETGTAVLVGHLDSHTGPGVFHRLHTLVEGNEVTVTLADGSKPVFVVQRVLQFPKDEFPSLEVYAPTDEPTLRLVTCGGSFDRRRKHYEDNVVVFATRKATP